MTKVSAHWPQKVILHRFTINRIRRNATEEGFLPLSTFLEVRVVLAKTNLIFISVLAVILFLSVLTFLFWYQFSQVYDASFVTAKFQFIVYH